jgi:hypothetical protein
VLMNQSSWDDTLVGVRPPRTSTGDAVSFQSSRDKQRKRSPAEASAMEGRPISNTTIDLMLDLNSEDDTGLP